MDQNTPETEADRHAISFVVAADTLRALERVARQEGLSRASVARRALLRDLSARNVVGREALSQ